MHQNELTMSSKGTLRSPSPSTSTPPPPPRPSSRTSLASFTHSRDLRGLPSPSPPSPAMPTTISTISTTSSSPSTAVVVRITPLLLQQAAEASRDGGDTLDFSRSKLTEVGEEGLDGLAAGSGGKGVRRLALSHNSLTSLPISFTILTRLRYLNLKGNDLREVPAVLGSLQSLEILDISKNKIKRMPERPGRLASLRVLSLSQNRLRALPAYMADFTELKVFKVEQNPLEWPPREIMDRPANSEGEEAEKLWILSIREFMRAGGGGGGGSGGDEATDNGAHHPTSNRTNHTRTLSHTTKSHSRSDSHQSSSSHYRSYSNSNNFPPSLSNDSFASPPVDREHGRNDSGSTRGSSTNHSTETVTPRSRSHSRTLSNSTSRPPSPPSSEGRDRLDQVVLPPPPKIVDDGYPSPSPSPIDGPSHIDRLPPPPPILEDSAYDPSSNDSSPLDPSFVPSSSSSSTPRDRSNLSHSRNASFNSQPQRLSQLLSAKKSLPDLRQPHSQIMSERQGPTTRWPANAVASGSGSSSRGGGKIGGVGMTQSRTTSSGDGSEGGGLEPPTRVGGVPGSLRSIRRKLSDDGMRRPSIGSPLSQQGGAGPFPSGRPLPESNILDPSLTSSPPDASRDSYFRRLSTLQGSTLPKTVPPALLTLIDSARGLLFALSQIQSSLRQHSFSAIDGVFSGVLAKVLAPAGEYTDRLINALDRFDSISRRAAVPPPEVIRGVVEACKDDVAVFGKVIAVLLIQLKASSAQQASTSYEDVRFSRTLLLMLYGAMAEVANAWKNMHPLIDAVAPLLRDLPRPITPTSRQHHIPTISNTTGTPISPIPERTESYSPPSIHHHSPIALTRSISAQPFPSSLISSPTPGLSTVLTAGPPPPPPPSTPLSTPGPPSQAARSKSRRHAGSFSSHDVQVGARIPPMPSPSPGSIPEAPIVPTHPPANHRPSTSSSTSPPTTNGHPSSHQIPLRSALRNPFASPTSSPNPNGPPPNVTYDTSPFSHSEGFPPPRGPTNGLHTVNGSLSPNPMASLASNSSLALGGGGVSPAMSMGGGPPTFRQMNGGGGGHSTSSSMSSSVGVPISPRVEKDRYLFGGAAAANGGGGGMLDVGGGAGGRGDATNRVVDEEMLDTMGVAVEAAFGVWVLIEEDMAGDFNMNIPEEDSSSTTSSSNLTSSPIDLTSSSGPPTPTPRPDRRTLDLLTLLERADSITRRLYQSIGTSSLPPTSSSSRRQDSTLADDAQQFFQVVVQVCSWYMAKSDAGGVGGGSATKKPIKVALKNLTRLCAASATLLQVSSMKRPSTSLGLSSTRPMSPEEVVGNGGGGFGGGLRPLALGRSRSATGGAATLVPFVVPALPRSAQPMQQAFPRAGAGPVGVGVGVGGGPQVMVGGGGGI